MAKLMTHEGRMAAIEEVYGGATVMEKAALIELANRLCREDNYSLSNGPTSLSRSAMQTSH